MRDRDRDRAKHHGHGHGSRSSTAIASESFTCYPCYLKPSCVVPQAVACFATFACYATCVRRVTYHVKLSRSTAKAFTSNNLVEGKNFNRISLLTVTVTVTVLLRMHHGHGHGHVTSNNLI